MNREELKKEAQEQVNYCTPLYPESFIQGYIASAEPREKRIVELEELLINSKRLSDTIEKARKKQIAELENKITDIKANCDLAIEGRDIKIKELERLNSNQAESLRITMLEEEKKGKRIEELEKENKTLEGCLLAEQEYTLMLEQQIEKMKCCENCKNQLSLAYGEFSCDLYGECKHHSKWEIKENV